MSNKRYPNRPDDMPYQEWVELIESKGRACFKRGGHVWHDNPYPHGGEAHAHWFVGFAETKYAKELEQEQADASSHD